jgi:hypothetical protein
MGGAFGLTSRVAGGDWAATDPSGPPPPDQPQGTMAWLRIEVETGSGTDWMEVSDIHAAVQPAPAREEPPPPERVANLLDLCARGDVDGLHAHAEALRGAYPAFARQLQEFTENIRLDELERWLKK